MGFFLSQVQDLAFLFANFLRFFLRFLVTLFSGLWRSPCLVAYSCGVLDTPPRFAFVYSSQYKISDSMEENENRLILKREPNRINLQKS